MARLARVVAVGIPHHVTQRGNARQFILSSDAERLVYLELLREYATLHQLSVLGYCLMSNHVHLVVVPQQSDALAKALKQTHGRYAAYWNAGHKSSGHAWQGRYYSCPLDEPHLWEALRYTELNPVRAGMVAEPESWTGRAQAPIWVQHRPTVVWPWIGGRSIGPLQAGANTWRQGRRTRRSQPYAKVRTPGARWGPRNSLRLSKRVCNVNWLLKKEAG